MMYLDTTDKSLEIVLGGAVATNQAVFSCDFVDVSTSTFGVSGILNNNDVTNSTTPVTLIAAPGADTSRQVKGISIYNADTADIEVTVSLNDNSTIRSIVTFTVEPGFTLAYLDTVGWKVVNIEPTITSTDVANWNTAYATTLMLGTAAFEDTGTTAGTVPLNGGDATFNSVTTDTISESTADAGVTIDGLLIKDGGIYLGGTAAANFLDDYEEGTFNPTYVPEYGSFASISYAQPRGASYTITGNRFFCNGYIATSTLNPAGASGMLRMGGLPILAAPDELSGQSPIAISAELNWPADEWPKGGLVVQNSSNCPLYINGSESTSMMVSNMSTSSNSNQIRFNTHYRTA